MSSTALDLAHWANRLVLTPEDRALAHRSLVDTLAVSLAARGHKIEPIVAELDDATRWAALGHVLDFDDLHMTSTTHVSVVCVAATLAAGGDERSYLAGAGVMARLGTSLGWAHYAAGWHATCTAGAPAAAVAASIAYGLTPEQTATAIALSVPAAGGVQRAFGTDSKSLQVGFVVSAGLRAARLAAAGASADLGVLEEWMGLVGADRSALDFDAEIIPGGLAIKLYPCCYALQRPIAAIAELNSADLFVKDIIAVRIDTPKATVQPLIHHRPETALEGKFSLEYSVAATLLDRYPGFASFTDDAVRRPEAQRLIRCVETHLSDGGDSLLSGEVTVEIESKTGPVRRAKLDVPPGAPTNPPSKEALVAKLADCGEDVPQLLKGITWPDAAKILQEVFLRST